MEVVTYSQEAAPAVGGLKLRGLVRPSKIQWVRKKSRREVIQNIKNTLLVYSKIQFGTMSKVDNSGADIGKQETEQTQTNIFANKHKNW